MTRRAIGLGIGILAALGAVSNAAATDQGTATVSLFESPPELDGEIAPGEWAGAVRIQGFQAHGGGVADKVGASWLGYTKSHLYVAVASELPPDGKLRAMELKDEKARDKLYGAGGLELWLDAHRGKRGETKRSLPYVQFIGNATGAIYDKKYGIQGEPPQLSWDGDWTFANGIHREPSADAPIESENGIWVAEVRIAFEELGLKESPVGRTIGALIVRNWKRKRGGQMSWFRKGGFYSNTDGYPSIRLTRDAPSVQVTDLGDRFYQGKLELEARIYNPASEKKRVKVHALAQSSNMPKEEQAKTLPLAPGEFTPYSFSATDFHANARHKFLLEVTDPDGDAVYFRHRMQWQKPKREKWAPEESGPNPKKAVDLAYYPSHGFFRIRVDPRELNRKPGSVGEASITAIGPGGDSVLEGSMSWDQPPARKRFEIGKDIDAGSYTVRVELPGREEPLARSFERRYFVWEGNDLGVTSKVYAPFEPVQRDGSEVRVVMRRYEQDGLGLWSSVEAHGNDRGAKWRELLAAPAAIRVNDGKRLEGSGSFVETGKQRAVYEGEASAPGVTVRTRCITEYDGVMRVEMTLAPGRKQKKLDRLWLEIPVREEMAPLFHASTTGLRNNPAGEIPAGEDRVWDSRDLVSSGFRGNFQPYVWLGGPERGICWFADNDRGWVVDLNAGSEDPADPAQEIVRKKGRVVLRVNLVQKPVKLEEPRKIVFGLMATPAKPMPENWRNVFFRDNPPGPSRTIQWMAAQYWASPSVMYSKLPIDQDTSVLSKLQELRLGGSWGGFMRAWTEKHLSGDISDKTYKSKKKVKGLLQHAGRIARHADDYLTVYWEEFHNTHAYHPEAAVFGDEWASHAYPESYLNFAAWCGAEFIRRGMGLYFDNTFPKVTKDPVTTAAYRLPSGEIQPSANMWRQRRYLRRIWVLHQQLAPEATKPLMMLHMTNTHIPPYMVYADSNLDLEWLYGAGTAQSKYPPDLLRAESIGLQSGNIPTALAKGTARSRFGAMMVHEIKAKQLRDAGDLLKTMGEFGYTAPDARVHNYWDPGVPLSVSDDKCKWLLVEHEGKAMVLLCTWRPTEAEVTVEAGELGTEPKKAVNVETGEAKPLEDGRFTVTMPGYGVRLFRLE